MGTIALVVVLVSLVVHWVVEEAAMILPVQHTPPSTPAPLPCTVAPMRVNDAEVTPVTIKGSLRAERSENLRAGAGRLRSRRSDRNRPLVDGPARGCASRPTAVDPGRSLRRARAPVASRAVGRSTALTRPDRVGLRGDSVRDHTSELACTGGAARGLGEGAGARGAMEVRAGADASAGGGQASPLDPTSWNPIDGGRAEGPRRCGRPGSRFPGRSYDDQRLAKSPSQHMAKPSAAHGRAA